MRQIKLILLIIGTIIGAGFVSGKEIAIFFSNYGYLSLIFIFPMFFLLYFIIFKLLCIGSKNKINNASDLNIIIFKKDNKVIKIFTFVSFVILSSTMFSAIPSALGFEHLGVNKILITLAISFALCFVISKDIGVMQTICLFVVPIILIMILFVCFQNFATPKSGLIFDIVLVPYNALNYVCRNMFLSYFVISKSSFDMTQKQCKQVSFFASLLLCAFMAIEILVELGNPQILSTQMPMLYLAKSSNILHTLYLIVLQFAIITTLISALVTLKSFFNFKNKISNIILPIALCASLSMIRFDYFVEYLYPIIGMMGFYLIVVLMFPNFLFQNSNKQIHKTSQNTKDKCT